VAQIDALAERGLARYPHFLSALDARLDEQPFVAGDEFSAADIDALVTIDFAERAIKIAPDDCHPALLAWRDDINRRLGTA
jgi:glutathione S-transferase